MDFLGFSRNESIGAFHYTVRETRSGRTLTYDVIRVVSTQTEQTLETFRQGAPSPAEEWQAAKPASAWEQFAAHADLWSYRVHHAKTAFRLAIDPQDQVATSLSTKKNITITAAPGSGLGMTPVVRLYDGRYIWLPAIPRAEASNGRTVTAQVEALHSRTGMHIAVIVHYSSSGGSGMKNDVARVYTMPGDPIGVTSIGAFNMTLADEKIGERVFGDLHPDFKEEFVRWGKDERY